MSKKITIVMLAIIMLFNMSVFAAQDPKVVETMKAEVYEASNGVKLPYRIYVPEEYNADKEYSFLVHLHGAGNRGDDNENQILENTKHIDRIIGGETVEYDGETVDLSKEFIIIAPQCAKEKQWVDTPWGKTPDPSYNLDEIPQSEYMTALVELINSMKTKYSLDSERMYATGLSMGGFGTWDLLMRYPEMWAAAVPMGGAADLSMAKELNNIPIWTFHQYLDTVVVSEGTQNIVKELVKAGGDVRFTPYFELQHNAWTKGYAEEDLLQWLYSHKKSDNKVKVACVGDSITYGAEIKDRNNDSYPAGLQEKLGNKFSVENFGVSATSALSSAKAPYINTPEYKASLEFAPDVLCIMLGTNDIKDENWLTGKDNFKSDYKAIIDSYKKANPDVKVYIGVPPQIFKANVYGERNPEILENEANPIIKELAEEIGADIVDLRALFDGKVELFPDFLHPNEQGAAMIADSFASQIKTDIKVDEPVSVLNGISDWAADEAALAFAVGLVPEEITQNYTAVINREAFCKMVVRMFGDIDAPKAPFKDVNNISVDRAYALGIVNGVSETEFNPNANITRQEMCAMLTRAFKKIATVEATQIDKVFPDNDKIAAWAMEDVKFMNSVGIMKGDESGNINPLDNTTNEEAILLVYRSFIEANSYGKINK